MWWPFGAMDWDVGPRGRGGGFKVMWAEKGKPWAGIRWDVGRPPLHQAAHFEGLPVYEQGMGKPSTNHPGKAARKLVLCPGLWVKIHLQVTEAPAFLMRKYGVCIYTGHSVGSAKAEKWHKNMGGQGHLKEAPQLEHIGCRLEKRKEKHLLEVSEKSRSKRGN